MSEAETERRQIKNDLSQAKEKVSLFKAAWEPFQEETFTCGSPHVLCKPVTVVPCKCEDQPGTSAEEVDLRTFDGPLSLVIHPSLSDNQPFLDHIYHTALYHSTDNTAEPITVTYAEIAASARNVEFLQHLFASSDQCVRKFYHSCYSYLDPEALLQLFVHALNSGSRDVVFYLVEKFWDELTKDVKTSILESCIWLATTDKTLEPLFQELVLRFGVNLTNSDSYTPLMLTCFYDNSDLAAFLVDQGADMYADKDGCTVSYMAYKYGGYIGRHGVLKTLLNKGLDVEAVLEAHSQYFRFPLMYTFIHHNETGLVRLLVERGYGVNLPIRFRANSREHQITPLMHALACKRTEIARWLIEKGANCNARSFHSQRLDDESWTPLHLAAFLGNAYMVRTLVEHGAQIDALTNSGETVICMAYGRDNGLDVVKYLLQINVPVRSIPGSSFRVKCHRKNAAQCEWSMLDLAVYSGDLLLTEALLQSRHYHHPPTLLTLLCQEAELRKTDAQMQAMRLVQDFHIQVSTLQVSSLQWLCRDRLRAACGTRLLQYVRTTVMPERLRSILLLEDVLGPVKTFDEDDEEE